MHDTARRLLRSSRTVKAQLAALLVPSTHQPRSPTSKTHMNPLLRSNKNPRGSPSYAHRGAQSSDTLQARSLGPARPVKKHKAREHLLPGALLLRAERDAVSN
ncbi:hypothetical protein NDU88_005614 [Pleurodeles waltl]|uniref:Uncharacterized protein n=1 Tax=Pleurodeles waltl TaxID=8319 RepID=A0AAV7MDG7_PLEWA|nr:hypothetical protein NDU88_005614 [Pleurodeles waltl]